LIRPATPSTLGPSRERTANGRRSSAGQHRVHSCDRRKGLGGATSARPGRPGFPTREPALPTETAREQSTRGARSSHPFGAGVDRSPVAAAGTGCSPANGTPEELRRLARPCVLSIALPLRFYYDYRTSAKISGVLTHRTYTNILGRPATGRVTSGGIVPESAKDTPNSCDKVARLRSYEIRVGLEQGPYYCSYGTHGAVRTPWRKLSHGA